MPTCPIERQRLANGPPDPEFGMSVVLALDCAVSGLGVAVVRDGACLAARREEGRDQAVRLFPVVASALRAAAVARHELSLVAVTIGPGSFTGVRVGLASARGLALGLGVPLAGVSTTSVLAAQAARRASASGRLAVAAIDSRLGDWFCAIGEGHLVAAGVDSEAEVASVDPVTVARLALAQGVDAWRARNASEGLPRPLYLRGVSITLPDGVRRTVD
ncbi:MAG: tRNA (adenosine(37)-N6)-threonylcarbamoyltransferase complex dimerization subunit type 1 TsaB [Alphaproteobacteria bacterium]|nr:tRNA (adenosine(37)-N6)-threonylcarbamoyltransferase complex dimerization subunit type 1 TsaB [Alphaproteobacteria bacterium]